MSADLPHNEPERLAALRDLDILDSAPEEVFDRITRLAAHIIDAPIVLISFVDENRQWFKSKIGLDADETHRELAFCAHAILNDEVMVVPDALNDPRFADNPLVTGNPDIRFYAGAPMILSDDVRLGTLCAIDTKPRELSGREAEALRDLSAIVVDELNLRKSLETQVRIGRELNERAIALSHANQALEQYAYMASHDLRAPLKKIINLADLAIMDSEGDALPLAGLVRSSAAELEELVLGYERLARLEQGHRELEKVSTMISKAQKTVGSGAAPVVRGDASLHCDPGLVTQALVNLFSNAMKHGSGEASVEIVDGDDSVEISVSNPIDRQVTVDQSIFAPFRRLDTSNDGSGLGLAIVERVMQLHDGSASVNSADQQFTIELSFPKPDHT